MIDLEVRDRHNLKSSIPWTFFVFSYSFLLVGVHFRYLKREHGRPDWT